MRTLPHLVAIGALLAITAVTASAQLVMSAKVRINILTELETILNAGDPDFVASLPSIPDPFLFGRVIPSQEEEETDRAFFSPTEILGIVGARVRGEILGVQRFGERTFVATRNLGLISPGETLTFTLPEYPDEIVEIAVAGITEDTLVLAYRNLQTRIPLTNEDSRIQRLP